jgi:hypothetical protein
MKKNNKKCTNPLCPEEIRLKCTDEITDKHHKYSQTQYARRTYGSLLDEKFNLVDISNRCHLNKSIPSWSEKEFIEAAQAEGFRVNMPKSLQYKTFN